MRNPIEVIEELQQKPEGVRRRIAVVAVVSIMFVIVWVWITSFSLPSTDLNVATVETPEAPSPFSLIWNYAKETVKGATK